MLDPISVARVVSTEATLDHAILNTATFPAWATVLRTAPDEVMLLNVSMADIVVDDDRAIIVDDTGWNAVWIPTDQAKQFLRNNSSWELPAQRPTFAQGKVADTAVKLWIETDRILFVVPHVAAHDFAARLTADGVTL